MKMYEPDLAHIKRQLPEKPPAAPTLPKDLPPIMIKYGYRLYRNVLYFGDLPMSEMSTKGILMQFREYMTGEDGSKDYLT